MKHEVTACFTRRLAKQLLVTVTVALTAFQSQASNLQNTLDSSHRIKQLMDSFRLADSQNKTASVTDSLQINDCHDYPYHNNLQPAGNQRLVEDLKQGLQQGLMCLTGKGPMGQLHPYHHAQALRLISTFEDKQPKLLQCVRDELFAYAMAKSTQQKISDAKLAEKLQKSPDLSIFLDTYRIGGLLSQKFKPETYKLFFKLDQDEITQHLTGKPMKLEGIQRYENLPGLLFHETVHWLGHWHTNINPDITFLYETCCFGGSEYINDEQVNAQFQNRACNILKDKELWSAHPYKKMRIWHHKEYDLLKREMRDYY